MGNRNIRGLNFIQQIRQLTDIQENLGNYYSHPITDHTHCAKAMLKEQPSQRMVGMKIDKHRKHLVSPPTHQTGPLVAEVGKDS